MIAEVSRPRQTSMVLFDREAMDVLLNEGEPRFLDASSEMTSLVLSVLTQ